TALTTLHPLSLHDALPIFDCSRRTARPDPDGRGIARHGRLDGDAATQGRRNDPRNPGHRPHCARHAGRPRKGDGGWLRRLRDQADRFRTAVRKDRPSPGVTKIRPATKSMSKLKVPSSKEIPNSNYQRPVASRIVGKTVGTLSLKLLLSFEL